jgi:hypothetical protein
MSGPLDEPGGDLLDNDLSDFDDEDVDLGEEAPSDEELTADELEAIAESQDDPGTPDKNDPGVS